MLFGGSRLGWVFCGTGRFGGRGGWRCLGGVVGSGVASASVLDVPCFCLL